MKQHSIEYIKRMAKKLKKQHNISHTQALEMLAKQLGYKNYNDLLKQNS